MAFIEIGGRSLSKGDVRELLETDHPMVQEFRFVKQQEQRGQRIYFALLIVPTRGVRYQQQRDARGRRIKPLWKTLTGTEQVGQGNRVMWLEGDELVAENCTFFPNQEFNDLGIGSALYVSMERLYRHLRIRRVTLLAVDVGVYVWARQGFAFNEGGAVSSLGATLRDFLRQRVEDYRWDPSQFQESWDFANFDVEGIEIDGYRAGKYFMLHEASPWYGIKYLDSEQHSAIAEASRRETFSRLPDKIEGAAGELKVR